MNCFRGYGHVLQHAAVIALLNCLVTVAQAEEGYQDLFNGKDLTGWDGNPELWSVQDGVITGIVKDKLKVNQFLVWTGGKVDDFELKLDIRMEGDSNSGIQYRSQRRPEIGDWVVSGYQADFHPAPKYTAMLYDERGRGILAERGQKVVISKEGKKEVTPLEGTFDKVDLSQWHELAITCVGTHLIHKLDGVTVVDVEDAQDPDHDLEGVIAIQVHVGPPMKVQVRNIRLKALKIAPAAQSRMIPEAAPAGRMMVTQGFKLELLHSATKKQPGSLNGKGSEISQNAEASSNPAAAGALCVDTRGRLIVSDPLSGLLRITPPGILGATQTRIEQIDVPLGDIQGLLWAFDSLYAVVSSPERTGKYASGVYRIRDTDDNDQLDSVELLRSLPGKGASGPHAAVLSPSGDFIDIVCGNLTALTDFTISHVPACWDEDVLLPRLPDSGLTNGVPAPGGYIARMSPDGQHWELVTVGFRNPMDAAYNADGELFTCDTDLEQDLDTPWYRPARICQVLSGADYGWRSGSAKYPAYFADTAAPTLNLGPESPTGMCFGYGARFPEKFQQACFVCDARSGKLSAVQLQPQGAGYHGIREEFITQAALPLTDVIINPVDGAMYLAAGNGQSTSELYRITYTGTESTAPVPLAHAQGRADREQLRKLQALHSPDHPEAVQVAWPFLSHPDPVLRTAARTAIEFRPLEEWASKALNEQQLQAKLESLMALCRSQARDLKRSGIAIDTPPPDWENFLGGSLGAKGVLQVGLLTSLSGLDWTEFTFEQRLQGLRVVQLVLLRCGQPDLYVRDALLETLGSSLPAKRPETNILLLEILIYLQSPDVAAQGVALLENADTPNEQMNYAKALASLRTGWTAELRQTYFRWLLETARNHADPDFQRWVREIHKQALSMMAETEPS